MVFHTLTFARSHGNCWKPRPKAAVFNTSQGPGECYIFARSHGNCWKPRPKAAVSTPPKDLANVIYSPGPMGIVENPGRRPGFSTPPKALANVIYSPGPMGIVENPGRRPRFQHLPRTWRMLYIRQVPWELLKTQAEGRGFQHLPRTWRMLMHWKTMFDRYKCIKTENICYILRYFLHNFVTLFRRCLANVISQTMHIIGPGSTHLVTAANLWPGTIILKIVQPCINSAWIALFIHGFSPVNARLLITCDTAFYAIIVLNNWRFTEETIKALTTLLGRLSLSVGWENGPERWL